MDEEMMAWLSSTISSSVATPSGEPRMSSTLERSCCADSSCGLICTRGFRRLDTANLGTLHCSAAHLLLTSYKLLLHEQVVLYAFELQQAQLALGCRDYRWRAVIDGRHKLLYRVGKNGHWHRRA